jgi:hypothetical protein
MNKIKRRFDNLRSNIFKFSKIMNNNKNKTNKTNKREINRKKIYKFNKDIIHKRED